MDFQGDNSVDEATNYGDDGNVERRLRKTIQEQLSLKPYEPFILFLAFLKVKYMTKKGKFSKFLEI